MRAIKMLDSVSIQVDEDTQEDVKREVEIQAQLSNPGHENVCKLYECCYDYKYLFLVLEFCAEGDLYTCLTSGMFPPGDNEQVKDVFRQLMRGLAFLQANAITHMDLKAENVMMISQTPNGPQLKIIDFGYSIWGEEQPQREGGRGTTKYMAPEVYAMKGRDGFNGFRADSWSAGIMLCMLL